MSDPYTTWEPVHCPWCGRLRGALRQTEGGGLEYRPEYVEACCAEQAAVQRSRGKKELDSMASDALSCMT